VIEPAVFPGYHREIRFAILTLDGKGLPSYGNCSLVLREDMIEYRASVFEENSVFFALRHGVLPPGQDPATVDVDSPKGYRAGWDCRGELAVAKLHDQLKPDTTPDGFADLIAKKGKTTTEDEFIEVHIFGPVTIRTCQRVTINPKGRKPAKSIIRALEKQLAKYSIPLENP
jgi:hypothetical protein